MLRHVPTIYQNIRYNSIASPDTKYSQIIIILFCDCLHTNETAPYQSTFDHTNKTSAHHTNKRAAKPIKQLPYRSHSHHINQIATISIKLPLYQSNSHHTNQCKRKHTQNNLITDFMIKILPAVSHAWNNESQQQSMAVSYAWVEMERLCVCVLLPIGWSAQPSRYRCLEKLLITRQNSEHRWSALKIDSRGCIEIPNPTKPYQTHNVFHMPDYVY